MLFFDIMKPLENGEVVNDMNIKNSPVIDDLKSAKETVWINPNKQTFRADFYPSLSMDDILDASARLERFAPFIKKCFPETAESGGIIESCLTHIPNMKACLNKDYNACLSGALYLKQDNALPIAGSVKARGGVYEILKHTEDLAIENGILKDGDSYEKLADEDARKFFSGYTVQVGSTGNLGLSIGIMSAAVGYKVIVHMSADAKQWKKDLLRSKGVTVVEYDSDYSEAVKQGRLNSDMDEKSYFVDDENSVDLFLGYAVAAKRIKAQFEKQGITVDEKHPLFVYIPCGVGGAPGGITFGLKQFFGDNVHVFFAEPTQAPCMLLGLESGLNSKISVADIGLSGITEADGLAVGRASGFAGDVMDPVLSGEFTVCDGILYDYMRSLCEIENIFIEPSACAGVKCAEKISTDEKCLKYIKDNNLENVMENSTHIVWGTGGDLVPENVREQYKSTYIKVV